MLKKLTQPDKKQLSVTATDIFNKFFETTSDHEVVFKLFLSSRTLLPLRMIEGSFNLTGSCKTNL